MHRPAVIVTGASGFVGRHLLDDLKTDHRVFAIARRSQRECGAPVDPSIAWMQVDIADRAELARTFREIASAGGAKLLIHLAAYYDFTGEPHPEYRRTNIEGTRNLLEVSRECSLERVVFASSVAACDFPRPEGPITETTPPDGRHVYAWSKREGERLVREWGGAPTCIVRLGAVFSDWCEYPPLYTFVRSWLSGSWRGRVLPGTGEMAIPYVHVQEVVRFLRRLIEVHDRIPDGACLIASAPGTTPLRSLYDLATRHHYGSPSKPILVPRLLCGVGLYLLNAAGALTGRKPFERPWMRNYIDRQLSVDIDRSLSLLGWAPSARHRIEKRLAFMVERRRSEPLEWTARNDAAIRRDPSRPGLRVYRGLITVEDLVIDEMIRFVQSESVAGELPHYRRMEPAELRWILKLLYRLLLTSIQTGNRMLILNYLSLTLGDRFRAGFTGPEVVRLLEAVNRTILAFLGRDRDLAGLGSLLYEGITVPIEFGIEETREQYERHLQGAAEPEAPSDRPETGPATARELLEQTIWSCLVQRK